jgi:uncharacterized protein YceK
MKYFPALVLSAIFAVCVLTSGCSGVRPLQKGETIRCPSCGAEFTIEQGQKAKEKQQ